MAIKRDKVKFETLNELLGAPDDKNETSEISVSQIQEFKNHPFKVKDDEHMEELVESIRQNGILTPVLIRPLKDNRYEMVSGHRRLHAAKRIGLETIPAVVKELTDDEATIFMVDANVQREEILPSERAWSFKMKMDALSHQGERSDLQGTGTCGTEFHKSNQDKKTRDSVGFEAGMTGRQVQKYIRLTKLIPELLDMVDEKKITMTVGVEIANLSQDVQQLVLKYIGELNINQIKELKEFENVTEETILELITEPKRENENISFTQKSLDKYFPSTYTKTQRQEIIIKLLEEWAKNKAR